VSSILDRDGHPLPPQSKTEIILLQSSIFETVGTSLSQVEMWELYRRHAERKDGNIKSSSEIG
jgi:hypothetical protein